MALTFVSYGSAAGGTFSPFNIKWTGTDDWYETLITINSTSTTVGTVITVSGDVDYFEVPATKNFAIGDNTILVKFLLPASPVIGNKTITISFPGYPDFVTLSGSVWAEFKAIWAEFINTQYRVRLWSWAYGLHNEGSDYYTNHDIGIENVTVTQEYDPYECSIIPTTAKLSIVGDVKLFYSGVIYGDITNLLDSYGFLPVRYTECFILEVFPIPLTTVTYPTMYIKYDDIQKTIGDEGTIVELNFTDGLDRLASVPCFLSNASSPYNPQTYGYVRALTVTNCGHGYSGTYTITLPYCSGDDATYTVTTTHGAVTDIVVNEGGNLYIYSEPNTYDRIDCAISGSISGTGGIAKNHFGGMPFLATSNGYKLFTEALYWFARNAIGALDEPIVGYNLNGKRIWSSTYGIETSFNSEPSIASKTWTTSAIGDGSLAASLREILKIMGAMFIGDYTGFTWHLKYYDDPSGFQNEPIGANGDVRFTIDNKVIDLVISTDNQSTPNIIGYFYNPSKKWPKQYLTEEKTVINTKTAIQITTYGRLTETNPISYEFPAGLNNIYYGTTQSDTTKYISLYLTGDFRDYGLQQLYFLYSVQRQTISLSTPTDFTTRTDGKEIALNRIVAWTIDGDYYGCIPTKITRDVKELTEDLELLVVLQVD